MAKKPPNRIQIEELKAELTALTKQIAERRVAPSAGWPSRLPDFRQVGRLSSKADASGAGSPVKPGASADDDRFRQYYAQSPGGLVEPLVAFEWLWMTYTQIDVLNTCTRSYVDNICNPGDFVFGGTQQERQDPIRQAEYVEMRDFFSQVNDRLSFTRLRRKMERSLVVNNVWYLNVLRDENRIQQAPDGTDRAKPAPNRFYYIPAYQMRASSQGEDYVNITVKLPRRGNLVDITIPRQFRRFARKSSTATVLEWFKELGDPRIMSSRTGEYYRHPSRKRIDRYGNSVPDWVFPADKIRYPDEATEIWWHRGEGYDDSNNLYGLSFWFAGFWDLKGRQECKWVNFDHLDRGAIPPGMVAISGGKLMPGSKQSLDNFLMDWRTPQAYSTIPYLEVEPEASLNIDGESSSKTVKIEWIKLRDPQHEDYMFSKYLDATEETIGSIFRLPPVLRGKTNTETYASAATAIEITESQVFQPRRADMDEKITVELLQNEFGIYGWKYQTAQSKIGDKETFYKAVGALNRASALSVNDTRALANQLLGTDLKPFEGRVYDEPVTLVKSLVDQGMIQMEGDSDKGTLEFVGLIAAAAQVATDTLDNAEKADVDKQIHEVAANLVEALYQVAALKYEAPTADQIALAM